MPAAHYIPRSATPLGSVGVDAQADVRVLFHLAAHHGGAALLLPLAMICSIMGARMCQRWGPAGRGEAAWRWRWHGMYRPLQTPTRLLTQRRCMGTRRAPVPKASASTARSFTSILGSGLTTAARNAGGRP